MRILFSTWGNYKHTLKGILLRLALFLAMMALMRYTAAQVKTLSGGQGVLDLSILPSPAFTAAALSRFTGKARLFYQWGFFSVDMVYVMSYCTFYRCAVRYFIGRCPVSDSTAEKLAFMPVIGGTADLLENTVLFMMLGYGTAPAGMCAIFCLMNTVKFIFVYASLITVILGAVYTIRHKID
ncbi:MAG: hypothetical protein ILP19_06370 [Oscillospiraceae bacterium]|nr:hypothetical protein [Oscillospiraceae bacterium]